MSTNGTQSNEPMDLLVALGVNDAVSKKNINTYIKRLKNINTLTINFDVKGFNTTLFIEYEQQMNALQQHLDTLNVQLQNVGAGSSPTLSQFNEFKQQITTTVKSIDKLNEAIDDSKVNVKSFYKRLASIPTGDLQSLEQLLKQLKIEVEKVNSNQIQLNGLQETQQSLQNLETTLSNFYALYHAYANNTDFEQLSSQISDLNTQINDIQFGEGFNIAGLSEISSQLENINQGIMGFSKNTKEASQSSTSLGDTFLKAIDTTSTLKEIFENTERSVGTFGKTLLSATGIGLGFMAVDFVIGKISESIAKAKQKAEDFEAAQKEMLNTYDHNSSTIDSLIPKYERLSEIVNNGNADNITLAEYRDIQNELATLLPSLATGEEEYGKKMVGSVEAIKIKTALLKEQLAIEKENVKSAEDKTRKTLMEDKLDTNQSNINRKLIMFARANDTTNRINKNASPDYKVNFLGKKEHFWNDDIPIYNSIEKLQKLLPELKNKLADAKISGTEDDVKYLNSLILSTERYINILQDPSLKLTQLAPEIKVSYIENLDSIISKNETIKGSTVDLAQTLSSKLIFSSNVEEVQNLHSALETLFQNTNASEFINNINSQFSKLEYASPDKFTKTQKEVEDYFDDIKGKLKLAYPNIDDTKLASIQEGLKQHLGSITTNYKQYKNVMDATGLSLHNFTTSAVVSGNELDNLASKMTNYKDVTEKTLGISSSYVDALDDSLFSYEALTNQLAGYSQQTLIDIFNKEQLTAQEQNIKDLLNNRYEIMQDLASVYPDLLNNDSKFIGLSSEKIKTMIAENKANDALLYAYKLYRENKLTEEQKATLDLALETNKRIAIINYEIAALEKISKKIDNPTSSSDITNLQNEMSYHRTAAKVDPKKAELVDLTNLKIKYGEELSKIGKNVSSVNTAEKNANKTTQQSTYITDTYKQSLENLNLEIEKQVKLQSTLPKHSEEYRKSLEQQLKLEKDKLSIIEKQANSIQSQVSSSKINKTGMITSNESTSSTAKKISGWSGKITSSYGGRLDPITGQPDKHLGIDISAKKGTRLEANVSGTVVKAGNAVKNKEHESYGNIVVIRDDSGIEHLYAHLDKTVAKVGEYIQAGTYIGDTGKEGRTTGPHLHYETRKNGLQIDPTAYYNNAKSGTIPDSSNVVATGQQAIDQAKSELINLQMDILNQKEAIAKLEKEIIDAYLLPFEYKKSNYDKFLENSANRLKKYKESSKEYRNELDKQAQALIEKKKINVAEIEQLKQFINSGQLSAAVVAEYTEKLHELGKINSEIDFAIVDVDTSKLESYVSLVNDLINSFEDKRKTKDSVLDYEYLVLNELDTASLKYQQSLEKINTTMREKQNINRQELSDIQNLMNTGQLFGEALTTANDRATDLKKDIKQLQLDIQDNNYEIIVNIKTQSNVAIADMQFEKDRAEGIRKMYEEGSADYAKYTDIMLKQQEKIAEKHLETSNNLAKELKQQDITIEKSKQIEDLLKAETLAYINATLAVKDYTKQLEEANKSKLEKIANDLISAYKDYVQERRDEHMKLIEDEINQENEKHEKNMNNLQDEMDLFRKNVEDKLKLLDRQESERDYEMEIGDMEKERNNVQSQYNLLLLDNSHEAKSKRKKLQEQLDELDKQIAERRHDREIELRKESLNDALETKEEEIDEKTKLQEKEHENIINNINREKEYWEKHYNDLLNDERKFAQLRKDIMAENFDKITADFQGYINEMKLTMPGLADTMNGTMKTVGFSIRQNVIDQLEEALNLIAKFNDSQIESNVPPEGYNPDIDKNYGNGTSSKGNLSEANLKVLLGKFLTDNVANMLTGAAKEQAHYKGNIYGEAGHNQGATISKNTSFDSAISGLTNAEMETLKAYFKEQSNISGGAYNEYFNQFVNGGAIGGNSENSYNNASKYGIGTSLSVGDSRVLTAKYFKDVLVNQISDPTQQQILRNTADNMAKAGRDQGSKIQTNAGYKEITNTLNSMQISQLKNMMQNYVEFIQNPKLQDYFRSHIASLDSGGYMNWSGSGIDGKGGKAIIAHPNEIMLDSADTKSLFNSINVMDKIFSTLSPLPESSMLKTYLSEGTTYGNINIEFNIDKMNGDMNDLNKFSKMINDNLLRKKGMRP
ncbi:peptidoglycan DD-metalloendopeptidase family protein [Lysinibacillus sp. NPDC097279]|uniref:peptidoglycan DD-metalloendopeptidase family protein n=1 Tax=Lysinibacillus sp. NPDC097279 TaxID=3364143 RepID=UPI00382D483D